MENSENANIGGYTTQRYYPANLNIIDLSTKAGADMTEYDASTLYKFKEPAKFNHGMMYLLREQWFLTTPVFTKYATFKSIFNKDENHCFISSAELASCLNHIANKAYMKLKGSYTHIKAFDYGTQSNYLTLSKNFTVFDEDGVNISKQGFDLKSAPPNYKVKFLIKVFGIYVYEHQNSRKLKVSIKIEQMKLCGPNELTAAHDNANFDQSYMEVCLL